MNSVIKAIGIIVSVVIVLVLIFLLIMGFFARRRGQTIIEFIQSRQEAKKAADSQDITDTSQSLIVGLSTLKLESNGKTRTAQVYIPASYNSANPAPLVIGYHGGYAEGENQEKLTHMNSVADKEGFLVVNPDGINRHWNDGRAKAVADGNVDDVQFTKDLIAAISTRLNVDQKRIYATGISNGGMMTYRVAREMTQTFAAIAPVSSATPVEQSTLPEPSGVIPVLMMQGTADPLIPFDGGEMAFKVGEGLPTRDTLAFWVKNNGASTTPVVTQLPDLDANDGTTITHESYAAEGAGAAPVEFYIINGGGHTWAGGNQYAKESVIGKTSRDIDASQLIWDFFKQHSR